MATRADKIYEIIRNNSGRMKVADLTSELAKVEDTEPADLQNKVPSTAAQDNRIRRSSGRAVRFKIKRDGTEEHGYIGTYDTSHSVRSLKDPVEQIPELIEASNEKAKKQLKEEISNLEWQEFESSFMTQVLEALGFSSVEVTQATRDGGVDARCFYNRGIIRSEACVSAKKWKQNVGPGEVREMKGLDGKHDTIIIFTSASFTPAAKKAAEPQWNPQRAVVLIDGNLIVDTCFSEQIGVKEVSLPVFSEFVGFEPEPEESISEG
jgi:restriction endonuclease Mrr